MGEAKELSLDALVSQLNSGATAIRVRRDLYPASGEGSKVFPPTYAPPQGARQDKTPRYAIEKRVIGKDKVVNVVLLDSVQSQANRMEEALFDLHEQEQVCLPLFRVEIPITGRNVVLNSLTLPHRAYDGRLRACLLDGKPFPQHDVNLKMARATTSNATALYMYCPNMLVFGGWNSHDSKDKLNQARFQRAVVSEIIGLDAEVENVVTPAGATDPLGISSSIELYRADPSFEYDWTAVKEIALHDKKGKPVRPDKPSKFGLSAIAPTLKVPGGVTISKAVQTTVLSLTYLRRLHFPLTDPETPLSKKEQIRVDEAARTVLAALALCGMHEMFNRGYDLRSRCVLVPDENAVYEVIGASLGDVTPYHLEDGLALLNEALVRAERTGLTWIHDPFVLEPSPQFRELLETNQEAVVFESGEDTNPAGGE